MVRRTYEYQIGRDTALMHRFPNDPAIQRQGQTEIAGLRAFDRNLRYYKRASVLGKMSST